MSMPDISLEVIDPRIALASIVASVALQEAAVSHVLNAEGEKIQAVVGMTGATVTQLQEINQSVSDTVDNVALFSDDLQSKLQTALTALYPMAFLAIRFVDSATGEPVNCQCLLSTLTNYATGESAVYYALGDTLTLSSLKPGSYALSIAGACAGYAENENIFSIDVDLRGNVSFDGQPVDAQHPAVIELNEVSGFAAPEPEPEPSGFIPFQIILPEEE